MSCACHGKLALAGQGEVMHSAIQKQARERLRDKTLQAAIRAVERLQRILRDENTSSADAIRAAALVLDRVPQEKGEAQPAGDFEIVLKEGS